MSKDYTMDNLIKKYERDMIKLEKKFDIMKEMDRKGIDYNAADIVVSDEEEDSFQNLDKQAAAQDSKYED